jgi:hypothetical protein
VASSRIGQLQLNDTPASLPQRRLHRLKTRVMSALARDPSGPAARAPGAPTRQPPELDALIARIERLEGMLEGLQDAVHREATRTDRRLEELAKAIRPEELARSLSADARRRGL